MVSGSISSPSWRTLAFVVAVPLIGALAAAPSARAAAAAASAGAGASAHDAAAPAGSVRLPQVTVEGEPPADEPEAAREDPTAATTTVAARPGEGATVAELASAAPGVTVREFGLNQQATLSIRGSTADQVAVFFDGLPLNAAAGGGVDLSTLPASFVERLSVARGALGSSYGSGALGGALLIETRRPSPGERRFFGDLSYGSFASGDASGGAVVGLGEASSLLVTGFARSSRGDFPFLYDDKPQLDGNPLTLGRRGNNDMFRSGGMARLVIEGGTHVDLLLEADGGDRGLPGTLQSPTPHARQEDLRGLAMGRLGWTAAGVPLEAKAGGRLGRLSLTLTGDPPSPQDEAVLFGELAAHPLLGRHLLSVGASAGGESLSSAFHAFGEVGARQSFSRGMLAGFASDEYRYGPLAVIPAARLDRVGADTGFSPKLGLGLDLSRALALRANLGRAFRAPSFAELHLEQGLLMANDKLVPERAGFADLGVSARGAGLSATATAFFTLYEDVIVYELYSLQRMRPFNAQRAVVYGGELEASAQRGPLSLNAGYTLAYSSNRTDDERYFGKDLPYHPRHRLHVRGGVGFERWKAHAELDAQSSQFTNRTNTDLAEARARVDLGAAVLLSASERLWLQATLRNVFDTQDQDLYGYPLPGRSLLVSLRLDLDASPSSGPSSSSSSSSTSSPPPDRSSP